MNKVSCMDVDAIFSCIDVKVSLVDDGGHRRIDVDVRVMPFPQCPLLPL